MASEQKSLAEIDWNALRRRIEAAHAAVEGKLAADPVVGRRVLAERARRLAREPISMEDQAAKAWLEFSLAQERYALESRHVREVHPLESLTPVPCTPDFVVGIVNLRGEMLSVLDIKKFFGLPDEGLSDLHKIIVLASGQMCFGILADAILGVRRIPASEIRPPPPTLTGVREKYLKGVSDEPTVLLDAKKLLEDPGIVIRDQA